MDAYEGYNEAMSDIVDHALASADLVRNGYEFAECVEVALTVGLTADSDLVVANFLSFVATWQLQALRTDLASLIDEVLDPSPDRRCDSHTQLFIFLIEDESESGYHAIGDDVGWVPDYYATTPAYYENTWSSSDCLGFSFGGVANGIVPGNTVDSPQTFVGDDGMLAEALTERIGANARRGVLQLA